MGHITPLNKNVVVFDRVFKRSKQIATQFIKAGASVYLRSEGEAYEESHWLRDWRQKSQPFHCLLALVHDTDRREWEEEIDIAYDCLLYYSGGQAPVSENYIQRSLTQVYGLPTKAEARELLDWISLQPADRQRATPKLLTKFQPPDLLTAICILCQTYLYLIQQNEQISIADPAPLLPDAPDDPTQVAWWAEALNAQYSEFDELCQALQLEPMPENLHKLLEVISKPTIETPISADLIAAVHAEIQQTFKL
jgi:hypothetical protein